MLSRITPWPLKYALDPVRLSKNFDSVKSTYIFCTSGGDPINEILLGKLEGPYKVIESGRWPMITKPHVLARDLLSLTRSQLTARN